MQRRFFLLLLLLSGIGAAASADSIRRFEVFIDTDPGIGNGTAYAVTASAQADTVMTSRSFSIPTGIKPGWHTLYIRSNADTAGAYGRWSGVQARRFYVPEQVVAAEYFFDTDPGTGAATALTVTTPADTVLLSASIATTGLTAGKHTVYVRTRTNAGRWSTARARSFFVRESIASGEYFFDTDPGIGLGTAFTFITPSDTAARALTIATPSGLADGRHILYMRTRSNGAWSLAQARDFYVLPRITAAEYFWDTDPGVGAGTALAVTMPGDTIAQNYGITTTGLSGGAHRLYIRTRTASGRWSLAQERDAYITPKIVAAEYFWDTDPGAGSGIPLSVATQSDTVAQAYSIKAPCLAPGSHHIYIRTKDEFGHWSLTAEDTATFSNPSVAATATYPGPGPYGTPVKVAGSGGVAPYTYAYGAGAPTTDSLFLPPNGVSATFTATDTCGYSGSTTITTPATPAVIAGGSTGSGTVVLNNYRYWTYVQDASGNIIGAVRDYQQALGTVTMAFSKNTSGTVRSFPANAQPYLDRNWNINTDNAPVSKVGVQLFAVDSEYAALAAADPAVTSKSSLRISKYDGINEDLDAANNGTSMYTTLVPDSVVAFAGPATNGNGYALAFAVNNFSEFYEGAFSSVALPVREVTLRARKQGAAIQLDWNTTGEKNTVVHRLARGSHQGDFLEIAAISAGGGTDNAYSFTDRQPLDGPNYYRVAVAGRDGRQYYSQVVVVKTGATRMVTIAPNPASDVLHISGIQQGDGITLSDLAGHAIWQGVSAGSDADIHTAHQAPGIYILVIHAADGSRVTQRVEIMH